MQITLNQSEIKKAIIGYIESQGVVLEEEHTSVSLTAGRGTNGMSATVDIYTTKEEQVTSVKKETQKEPEQKQAEQKEDIPDETPLFGG